MATLPDGTEAENKPNFEFAWATCDDKDLRTRVCIKQQAVDKSFSYAEQLCSKLRAVLDKVDSGHAAAFDVLGGREIRAWMNEIEQLQYTSDDFQILLGVAGATGAGKTSLLNALLGLPELLPSSSIEASTACVCRVAWNHDDSPDQAFGADVVFRSKDDVLRDLRDVLGYISERNAIDGRHYEDENDRMDERDELNQKLSKTIGKVCLTWGLEEHELQTGTMSAESIVEGHPELVDLLGSTKTIASSDADTFAAEIKPYLDSTRTSEGLIAWPLINEVNLFVKSDVLKHGVVLVDLPGLSDEVGSRSAVAERYFQRLELTAIVTPVIRAADEKTGAKLMSDYQELRMQLDGSYHKKSFCVILSKIDDMDCDAFYKGSKEAKKDTTLQEDVSEIKKLLSSYNDTERQLKSATTKQQRLKSKSEKITEQIAKLEEKGVKTCKSNKGVKTVQAKIAKLRKKKKDFTREIAKQDTSIKNLHSNLSQTDRKMTFLDSRKKHRCIWLRNEHVKERIQADFARRQENLLRTADHGLVYDGSVEVFPVCTEAFRDLLKKKKPMTGFPSKLYTGVPRLLQWIDEATLDKREAHLDSLLHTLQRLFHGIKHWSQDNTRGLVTFSRVAIERLISSSHKKYKMKLNQELLRGVDNMKKLDPLRHKDDKLSSCENTAARVASRWAHIFPEDKNSADKMSWATYQAILRRDGGPYITAVAAGSRLYNFPQALAIPTLAIIVDDWVKVFHVELPKTEGPIANKISEIWTRYLDEVKTQIRRTAPEIMPYFSDTSATIEEIQMEMRDRVREAISSLTAQASEIHPEFVRTLQHHLKPLFQQALTIKGKGQFAKRQRYLRKHVPNRSRSMFLAGFTKMEKTYNDKMEELPETLADISEFAICAVKTQIGLLLNNLQAVNSKDKTALGKKKRLQQSVRSLTLQWEADWRVPEREDAELQEEDLDIPHEFIDEDDDCSADEQESNDGEMEDDNDSDGEMEDDNDGEMETITTERWRTITTERRRTITTAITSIRFVRSLTFFLTL
ncbi:hypothetical protein QBC46DRAFT_438550 [Diplogelasinospora grovesii]|uniref:Dynamin N-terminal domain-containing protein n=1 Tax=Diplogelasinospora grovesii TaxID=303347 RepID=A0AAN6N4M4_9PEZI|nr:hypothetical protein QBC46DRAFT_438550 [Diplogelasinospora grovesii]